MKLAPILTIKSGSTLYNLRTPNSDEDIRGCVLPMDFAYLVGMGHFEVQESKNPDTVLWNLPKFLDLAFKGNLQPLECLSAPNEFVLEVNEFGKFLRDNIDKFLGKHIYKVFQGFAFGEYKRALGLTTGDLGDLRKESIQKYGYSVKNAHHCLRLLYTGTRLFTTNKYTPHFPEGLERDYLLDIKMGKVPKENFLKSYFDLLEGLEKSFITTSLPEEPDKDFIKKAAVDYLVSILRGGKV